MNWELKKRVKIDNLGVLNRGYVKDNFISTENPIIFNKSGFNS